MYLFIESLLAEKNIIVHFEWWKQTNCWDYDNVGSFVRFGELFEYFRYIIIVLLTPFPVKHGVSLPDNSK